jgi:hypothetical protein
MNNSINRFITKSKKNEKKYYQTWKGNNKFCLKGKIYVGSEYYYGLLTFFYLLINYIFYILFIVKVSIYYSFKSRDFKIIILFYIFMKQLLV